MTNITLVLLVLLIIVFLCIDGTIIESPRTTNTNNHHNLNKNETNPKFTLNFFTRNDPEYRESIVLANYACSSQCPNRVFQPTSVSGHFFVIDSNRYIVK